MMKRIFFSVLAVLITYFGFGQEISGSWSGSLDIQKTSLRIVFNISEKDGGYISTMDSPDQGVTDIPTTSTTFVSGKLTIIARNMNMTYEGVLNGETIEGTFKQSGYSFPLDLKRGKATLSRPQTPTEPYTYKSEDVKFENKGAGITLAGTLTYPKIGTKFPAVVLISGTGPQNRDCDIMGHQLFLVMADYLTRNGIAVLRFDDRGFGESGGDYFGAALEDFAADAEAGMDYLKSRKEIDPVKIGIIGHSSGGTNALMISASRRDVAFVISMAGMALNGKDFMTEQRQKMFTAMGMPQSAIDQNEELVAKIENVIVKNTAEDVFRNPGKYINEILDPVQRNNRQVREQMTEELQRVAAPEMQSLMKYDPKADLARTVCPVFVLYGEKDLQTCADTNCRQVEKYVAGHLTTKKYPELNHLFQHAQTGLVSEYGKIEETISPEVLKDIADWILSVTKKRERPVLR